jgi:hypothetical protein
VLFSRIRKQTEGDKVFTLVYATEAIGLGLAACWKLGLTEATGAGVNVILAPATANLLYVAGVAPVAISISTYGLVQIYGAMTIKTTGTVTQGTHHLNTMSTTAGKCTGIGTDSHDYAGIGVCLTTAVKDSDGTTAGGTDAGSCLAFIRLM